MYIFINITKPKTLSQFCIIISVIVNVGEAIVILTAPSSLPCFGQIYKLTCTHPVLDADTNVRWERNKTGFNPQSTPNHVGDDPTPTTTVLTITVTREEFENKVYTYKCFTYDGNVGFNDPDKVISNEVTLDPPGEYACIYVCSIYPLYLRYRNELILYHSIPLLFRFHIRIMNDKHYGKCIFHCYSNLK